MTAMSETENSPAPQQSRGIYGFVLFIVFSLCIAFYLLWIFIPTEWTKTWPYEPPQKYWAAALPAFFCSTLFLFAFCIYPALHSLHDGELDDSSAITDSHAVKPTPPQIIPEKKEKKESLKRRMSLRFVNVSEDPKVDTEKPIPAAADMCINKVSQLLYLKNNRPEFSNE